MFMLSSCEKEVIIDLEDSVNVKVQQTIDSYISTLAGAPNGWLVDVMTSDGYYQFFMEFTDDNFVTMYTDNINHPDLNAVPKKSTYNIRSLQRITLAFDTYSYLAIINDPDNSISGGSGNQGLATDFDFEIDSLVNDVFTMTGRINRVNAKMRKATSAEKKAVLNGGLMNALRNVINYKADKFCYFRSGDIDVSVIFNQRTIDIAYIGKDGKTLFESSVDAHIRPSYDIELTESFDVAGKSLSGFKWSAAKREFSALLGSSTFELGASDKSVIPFYKLFGLDRKYTQMTTLKSLFDENNSNLIYRLITISSNMANTAEASIAFVFDEAGAPIMKFTVYVNTGVYSIPVTYSYSLTYNEEGDEFTVGEAYYNNDPYGYCEYLDILLTGYSIIRYWENKTFTVDWSTKTYNGWKMGTIIEKTNTNNQFPGVFF